MEDGPRIGGKYRLTRLIGAGGMGQVWSARHEVTEREFAVKLLLPQAATNADLVARFVREAKISGKLRHPNILEIFDVATAPELQGTPFLVMELLHGVTLEAAIRAHGRLPLRFTLLVAIAVTRALVVAHGRGVIHRDLKPANVLLHRDPMGAVVPKLLDFGISKLTSVDASNEEAHGITHTGAVLGSPRFMSPEQVSSLKDLDARSDVHALGVLVWWCLVGGSPYGVQALHGLLLEILSERRPRLLDVLPDAPPGVSDFVSRAFAREREQRYATAADALAVLEAELAKLGPGPTLETHAWVDDLLAGVPPQELPPVLPTPPLPAVEMTTHGGVIVTPEGAPKASVPPSPAAYTMGNAGRSTGPLRRRGLTPAVAAALGGVVAMASIAAGLLYTRGPHAAATTDPATSAAATTYAAAATTTANPSASLAPPVSMEPSAQAASSSVPSSAGTAPALAADGGETIGASATPVTSPAAIGARPGLVAHGAGARANALPPAAGARPSPSANDPFRGVTGTGL